MARKGGIDRGICQRKARKGVRLGVGVLMGLGGFREPAGGLSHPSRFSHGSSHGSIPNRSGFSHG